MLLSFKLLFKFCGLFKFKEHEKECEKLWKLLSHYAIVSNIDFESPGLKNRKTPHILRLSSFELLPLSALFKYLHWTNVPLWRILDEIVFRDNLWFEESSFWKHLSSALPEKSRAFTMHASWNFTTVMPKIITQILTQELIQWILKKKKIFSYC